MNVIPLNERINNVLYEEGPQNTWRLAKFLGVEPAIAERAAERMYVRDEVTKFKRDGRTYWQYKDDETEDDFARAPIRVIRPQGSWQVDHVRRGPFVFDLAEAA